MKLLLELLKKILSRLSNSYTKEETDGALSLKIGIKEFDDGLAESSDLRVAGDSALIQKLEANKANDDALANVVKWKTYAIAMQKMVDENLAIQIAEEFEKAAEKYLNDPTATEEWVSTKNEDGSYSTTSPYREHPSSIPIIDFNVVKLKGYYTAQSDCYGIFHRDTNVPVFLPSVIEADQVFLYTNFSSVISLPSLNRSQQLFQGGLANPAVFCGNAIYLMYLYRFLTKFNRPFSFPVAEACTYILDGSTSFNQPVSLPSATNCSYMLYGATSFNSTLELPKATNCSYMLRGSTSFNQPLSLPSATNCAGLLWGASSFNSSLDVSSATTVNHLVTQCPLFNQPLLLPKATVCNSMLEGATSFNQPLDLPEARNVGYILAHCKVFDSEFSAPKAYQWKCAFNDCSVFNQPISPDAAITCDQMLKDCKLYNQPLSLPKATSCSDLLLNALAFNQTVNMPACSNASNAFVNTAMSAAAKRLMRILRKMGRV